MREVDENAKVYAEKWWQKGLLMEGRLWTLPPLPLTLGAGTGSVGVSNPGVPGPTSKLSPRTSAQMGRRETEREGGKKPEGDMRERWNPAAFVFVPRPGRVRLQ
jgi:hypothetical protein